MINVTQATVVLTVLSAVLLIGALVGSLAFFGVFVHRQFPPEAAKKKEEPAADVAVLGKRSAAYRLGFLVLAALAVLTVVEYLVGVTWSSITLLLVLGLFKAGLIVQYFMHVARIWSEEEH
jgi:heme/copper-type cytochrome/quinol oxidase subunit 4